jgi:pimeloyl-ACP methyl ester carboxylesterase
MHAAFHDFSPGEATLWSKRMKPHPAESWNSTTRYCGWRDIPSVYIIAEGDRLVPACVQEQFASTAGSKVIWIKEAGHFLQVSRTEEVATIVREILDGKL